MSDPFDHPLVNAEALEPLLTAAGAAAVGSILAAFWAQADQLADALQASAEDGDAERARRVAHELKGCAANVGAGRVSAIAAHMERLPADEIAALAPQLKAAIADSRPALERYLDAA